MMAGWGSANKYGALGSLRSAAQLISYEIPIIMMVISVAMLAQSMNLVQIVDFQFPGIQGAGTNPEGEFVNIPYVVLLPLGAMIFLIAGLAEVGRTPFDIYFAESEIVGGPFVEYSGAHWSVFFLAEYMNTFIIAALTVLLFLGGWYGPYNPTSPAWLGNLLAIIWFLAKTYFVILIIFWIRGHLPPVAHRPANGLWLEGGYSHILRQRSHYWRIHVLRVAVVEPDHHVSGVNGCGRIRGVPRPDPSRAANASVVRPDRQEEGPCWPALRACSSPWFRP